MSRCFPYPPPGYTRNGIHDEALIQSIKLQREVEKAKKERKKEKRKEKEKANEVAENKKHRRKRRHGEERNQEKQKGGDHQKRRKIDTEHFEKSSLTEEHGKPAGSQNSADSTLNSDRRQNQCSPSDDRHNSGSIIRIRLPVQRHTDSKVLPSMGQPRTALGKSDNSSVQRMHEPASVLGRVREESESVLGARSDNPSIQQMSKPASGPDRVGERPNTQWMHEPTSVTGREGVEHEHPCSPSGSTGQELTLTMRKDKSCLSHGESKSITCLPKSSSPSRICRSCPPFLALQFRDLVENWVPSELEIECPGLDNESWLFEINQDHSQNNGTKSCEEGSVGLSYLNSMSWPHAQYLPDADIYALPFTVPF